MRFILTLIVSLVFSAALVSPASAADGHDHSSHGKAASAIYYCPMHPQVVSDKPGECPICHMRLVKREDPKAASAHLAAAESKGDPKSVCMFHDCPMVAKGDSCPMLVIGREGEKVECPACGEKMKIHGELAGTLVPAGYASVLVSPEKQQLIGIKTAVLRKKPLERTLRTSARVAYDPELYDAQIEYLREFRMAQGTLRGRELAFKNLVDSKWEAPRIDVAKSKLVLMGMDEESMNELVEKAKADETLLYLKPGDPVWIYVDVFEAEAPLVKKGDPVRIDVPSSPGKSYEGKVDGIGATIDPATRRVRVRVRVKNTDGFLRPNMLLDATIRSSVPPAVAVPAEAVFFTGRAAIVFVDKGQGLFEPRPVEVGPKAGSDYPVSSGLAEGERVVVNGNFLIDSESRLKASVEQAAALHAGHGAGND